MLIPAVAALLVAFGLAIKERMQEGITRILKRRNEDRD
jgi:hypothetical protein